jgi:hypothetical protein
MFGEVNGRVILHTRVGGVFSCEHFEAFMYNEVRYSVEDHAGDHFHEVDYIFTRV